MNSFILTFSLFLLLLSQTVFAVEKGCGPLEDFHKGLENKWAIDDYWPSDQIADFWSLHKSFGFLRHPSNDQVYLISKNESLSRKIIEDLLQFSGKSAREMETTTLEEFPNEVVFDVTNILPEILRKLHSRALYGNGPNCWNFCLRGKMTKGTVYMDGQEFYNWIASPFAEKIERREDLRPGDIMVFRNNKPIDPDMPLEEVHAAVYISPRLAAAKSGYEDKYMHRILDINEAISYFYPRVAEYVRVYRVRGVFEVLQQYKGRFPPELENFYREAFDFEGRTEKFLVEFPYIDVNSIDSRPEFQEKIRLSKVFKAAATPRIEELEAIPNRTTQQEIELTLWRGLRYKGISYEGSHI